MQRAIKTLFITIAAIATSHVFIPSIVAAYIRTLP